ncbi:GNAT family N-acetyltransferase [Roseovarius phycicola]|uniref:GNAT family N-acetyltransferase n=1 Tax=Roseovarius phycicola TaxID=3080976 RepID=A0ABZ2HCY3_9RHOB
MTITLRKPSLDELPALSLLCQRSKAHWGYDAAFMKACEAELTLSDDTLDKPIMLAETGDEIAGVAQLVWEGSDMDLDRLYIDPPFIGQGVGRVLFDWCVTTAQGLDAARLLIDAEPNAVKFYEKMGAVQIGMRPSGSIPGRFLPQLEFVLR